MKGISKVRRSVQEVLGEEIKELENQGVKTSIPAGYYLPCGTAKVIKKKRKR